MQLVKSFLMLSLAVPISLAAQTEYTEDGIPSPRAEEIRWILNRGRFNPSAENATRGTSFLENAKPPLAPNAKLVAAAEHHSADMAQYDAFNHATVIGSAYYDWTAHRGTTTADFAERIMAEGYSPGAAFENINGGSATPLATYLNWWGSSSHRDNMYDAVAGRETREIGLGHGYNASTSLKHFDTMVGSRRSAATGFFTDTLFRDLNSDNVYNEGEGIAGIRIDLKNNGVDHTSYDISTAVGSFAVSTHSIAAGSNVQVYLTNTTAAAVSLSIPIDYHTLQTVTLAPGQKRLWGSFVRAADTNAGFRNLAVAPAPLIIPSVKIVTATGNAVLSWPSETGTTYQVQWSPDLGAPWTNLSIPLAGTGSLLTLTDPATVSSVPRRFYKVIVTTP